MCIYNTFRHLSLQIYELYKEYASKKAKKSKGTKWNNPVSLDCVIFAFE